MSTPVAANPIPPVRIDGRRYYDLGFMAAEAGNIWRKSWLLAALASDVAEPKSHVVFDIGRESIIIARASDGGLHAYHNVCTHRGTRLLDQGAGTSALITCPYHAWCFNLDGSLKAAPDSGTFSAGMPADRLRLKPVKLDIWNGFIFISLDPQVPPLLDFLGPVVARMAPYRIDQMTLLEDQTVSVDCNWKAIIDNFCELYHVDHIHPQHKSLVDCPNATEEFFDGGHTGLYVPGFTTDARYSVPTEATAVQATQLSALGLDASDFKGRVAEIPAAIAAAKRDQSGKCGYDYSGFSDDQLTMVIQFNLFPNIILSGSAEGMWMMRSRPHRDDPSKSFLDKWTLQLQPSEQYGAASAGTHSLHGVSGDAAKDGPRPKRDCFSHRDVLTGEKSLTDTIDQDLSLLSAVQLGSESSGFGDAWLSDQEARLAHFHQAINAAVE